MRSAVVCLVVGLAGCESEQRIDDLFTEAEWDFLQTFHLDELSGGGCTDGAVRCEAVARFGQELFFDPRYAGPIVVGDDGENGGLGAVGETGKVACSTCHDSTAYFSDHRPANAVSLGTAWTKRNVPGLVDLAAMETFTWIGEHDRLEDVLELALTSGAALNSDARRLFDTIAEHYRDPYRELFGMELFPGMVTAELEQEVLANAAVAIATYERMLRSGPTPFDRYLGGEASAIDDAAKRGAQLFIGKAMCSECHAGPMFSDHRFHVTGVAPRSSPVPAGDRGRYGAIPEIENLGRFRTASLRHVTRTAPYMHAGQIATLEEVVELYRWGGDPSGFAGIKDPRIAPLDLTDGEARDLVAFLETLTGPPVPATWTADPGTRK